MFFEKTSINGGLSTFYASSLSDKAWSHTDVGYELSSIRYLTDFSTFPRILITDRARTTVTKIERTNVMAFYFKNTTFK